jgi:hypothetical protein
MKLRWLVILALILALVACNMNASGHRVFVGQKMTVTLSAVYDDGDPASDASVQVFRDGVLYSENKTNPAGVFSMVLPEKGVVGDWRFVVSCDRHEKETHFSIRDDGRATTAAAMGLLILPAAWIWRRRSGR